MDLGSVGMLLCEVLLPVPFCRLDLDGRGSADLALSSPPSCKVALWLDVRNKCWTADRLSRHRLQHLAACPFYDQCGESIDHLLMGCVLAREVWRACLGWCGKSFGSEEPRRHCNLQPESRGRAESSLPRRTPAPRCRLKQQHHTRPSSTDNRDDRRRGTAGTQDSISAYSTNLLPTWYFIIIDDIWESGTWETLKCAFVKNKCGSRIMITTRIVDVAKSCSPTNEDLVYEMKPLSEADSKKLFFKRIFGCEESCPDNLKEASKDILKKCRGLPLAINAISSLLATKSKTKEEWDPVQHSIRSSNAKSDIIENMNYILSLSYFDLPHHLRSCILYLALFPEDELIGRDRLVRRWISEGFIHGKSGQDLMELGEEYFHQLVNRSLIQPERIGYDGKAEYCRVHDTILDFLIAKSSEVNLCTVLTKNYKPDGIVRRISLMGTEDEDIVEKLDLSQARSIGAFGGTKRLPSLGKSKSLRVLDLQRCSKLENHHVKDIVRLYQLRYLDISFTGITELPSQIGDLLYLETLAVTSYKLLELPESITRLRRLARLFVVPDCKLPDGFGNLVNLQELHEIDALQLKHVEELGKLTNLRKLKIRLNTDEIECNTLRQSNKEKLVSSLCKLDECGLRSLSISYEMGDKDGEEPFLPALGCIREVIVHGQDICQISRWLASLPNLHMLTFMKAKKIEQQDIDMIGLIPNLLELSLYLHPIYGARQLIIRCEGFQQLQRFVVLDDARMGFLKFEPGAMPRLKELAYGYFQGAAVDFDFGIQHLSSLACLKVSLFCHDWTAAEFPSTAAGCTAAESLFDFGIASVGRLLPRVLEGPRARSCARFRFPYAGLCIFIFILMKSHLYYSSAGAKGCMCRRGLS
uniref:Uncharacterized protein n=1 Tax=Avena sativa TaxID=4498 RepID=A0ACD5T6K0_AVESA